jgi:predicted nucleotidyltransferase
MAKVMGDRRRRGSSPLAAPLIGRSLLRHALEAVRSVEPEAQVIFYGSRAHGDAMPESDWDLLVLLDGPADRDRKEAIRTRIFALEPEAGVCISTMVHSHEEWQRPISRIDPFHLNVENDGIDLATMAPVRFAGDRSAEKAMEEARDELVAEWVS